MSITGIGGSGLSQLFQLGRTRENGAQQALQPNVGALSERASPAASGTILPSANTSLGLSFETILHLQMEREEEAAQAAALEEASSLNKSATEKFLEEARKSPIERMREQILKELGLSEEALAALPPEEKRAAEEKIRQMIEEKLRQAAGAGDAPSNNAEMIELVA